MTADHGEQGSQAGKSKEAKDLPQDPYQRIRESLSKVPSLNNSVLFAFSDIASLVEKIPFTSIADNLRRANDPGREHSPLYALLTSPLSTPGPDDEHTESDFSVSVIHEIIADRKEADGMYYVAHTFFVNELLRHVLPHEEHTAFANPGIIRESPTRKAFSLCGQKLDKILSETRHRIEGIPLEGEEELPITGSSEDIVGRMKHELEGVTQQNDPRIRAFNHVKALHTLSLEADKLIGGTNKATNQLYERQARLDEEIRITLDTVPGYLLPYNRFNVLLDALLDKERDKLDEEYGGRQPLGFSETVIQIGERVLPLLDTVYP